MWGTNCAWGWARAGLAALRAATSIVTSSPLTNSCACASLRTKLSHLIWADEGIFQRNTGKRIFAVDIRVSTKKHAKKVPYPNAMLRPRIRRLLHSARAAAGLLVSSAISHNSVFQSPSSSSGSLLCLFRRDALLSVRPIRHLSLPPSCPVSCVLWMAFPLDFLHFSWPFWTFFFFSSAIPVCPSFFSASLLRFVVDEPREGPREGERTKRRPRARRTQKGSMVARWL